MISFQTCCEGTGEALGFRHGGTPEDPVNRPRRWRGEEVDAADLRSRQTSGAVWRQLSADRLRPVQSRELWVDPGRGPDPVQIPLPGPTHFHDVAVLDPDGRLRDARPRSAASWAPLVPGVRRRHLPVAQPDPRRQSRLRRRVRRGQHLPDGHRADGGCPHRFRSWLHGRGYPCAPQRGQRVRHHRCGGGQTHQEFPGETHRTAGAARLAGRVVRLDG